MACARCGGGANHGFQIPGRIGDSGQTRASNSRRRVSPAAAQRANRVHAKIGARRARLENPRQVHVQRGDRDVHRQPCCFARPPSADRGRGRSRFDLVTMPSSKPRWRANSSRIRARDFVAALGGLVRIGSSAEGDGFAGLYPAQFLAQQFGGVLLDVDFLFELHAVAHLHELVGVARVAVLAAELAAAIGIDGPGEGQSAVADAAVQQRLGGEREVFDVVAFAQRFAFAQPGGRCR